MRNSQTLMDTSSGIPLGNLADLSAIRNDIVVGVKFDIPNFLHKEYGIKDMLAPRSNNAFSTRSSPIWI